MEDGYYFEDQFGGDSSCALFVVFDGHGGKCSMEYSRKHMSEELLKALSTQPDVPEAFKLCFAALDHGLQEIGDQNGTTATCCLIRDEVAEGVTKKLLYTANVGDTRAFMVS
jgi:serine/threonine protein phosphatase PrpC